MLITVGMIDEDIINDDHFGQSKFFWILKYENGEIIKIEKSENPKYKTHQHAKVKDMLEFLDDCKVWVGRSMGKGSMNKLKELGYTPLIVKNEKLDQAIEEIKERLG